MLNCHSVILREVAKIEKARNAKKARGGAAKNNILSGSAAGFFCVPCFLNLRLTEYDGVAVEHIIPIAVERWPSDLDHNFSDLDQARRGG